MRTISLLSLVAIFALTSLGQNVTVDQLPAASSTDQDGLLIIEQPIAGRSTNDTQKIPVPNLLSGYARIYLPTNSINALYALEGRELNVYFANVIQSATPVSQLNLRVSCTKGQQFANCWRYTPTAGDAGTTTFTLEVWAVDGSQIITSRTCQLVTRALDYPASTVSRKLLIIGDSTTAPGTVSAELINLFDGDGKYTLTEVGSNNGDADDSDAGSRAVSMEAISGSDFKRFWTNSVISWNELNTTARTGSPFVNPDTGLFDFNYYQTNWIASTQLGADDWVIFNLGLNDSNNSSDASAASTLSTSTNALRQMIANIQTVLPTVRIGVALTTPPTFSQDAFGDDYNNTIYMWRFVKYWRLLESYLLSAYDENTVSGVSLVNLHANIDTANNFSQTATAYNARNTNTFLMQSNAVHPGNPGYYQIADSYRMFLKGKE